MFQKTGLFPLSGKRTQIPILFNIFLFDGVEVSPLTLRQLFGLLHQPWMMIVEQLVE
jgi:hypothetical protein